MPIEAIVTLVLATLIIAAAAIGLLRVIFHQDPWHARRRSPGDRQSDSHRGPGRRIGQCQPRARQGLRGIHLGRAQWTSPDMKAG
jgi:hypothetical protein